MHYSYMFGYPWGGMIMGFIFIVLIIAAVIYFARSEGNRRNGSGDYKTRGLEILTERFARGEIDAATFKSMKADLLDGPNK